MNGGDVTPELAARALLVMACPWVWLPPHQEAR